MNIKPQTCEPTREFHGNILEHLRFELSPKKCWRYRAPQKSFPAFFDNGSDSVAKSAGRSCKAAMLGFKARRWIEDMDDKCLRCGMG